MKGSTVSRRTFMKAATVAGAALAASGTLAGCLQQSTEEEQTAAPVEEEEVKQLDFYTSICHGCIASCACKVYVDDGVVTKIEGHPDGPLNQGSLCLKGLNQIHTEYSPRRVLYPMKRTGAKGAANATFERISWDEAIELTSDMIVETIEKYGTYSIFSSAGGGGSYVGASIPPLVSMTLLAPTGFEPGAAQCWMPRTTTAGYMGAGNDQSMADGSVKEPWRGLTPADKEAGIEPAMEVLVLWGTQPSTSQTAQAGRGMTEYRANGGKTIVVDPNFSADAAKATIHLPLRPGSDPALLLSWFRVIFEEKLYDEEFVKYWTNLPFLIDPDTMLPVYATELFPDFVQSTPEHTPAYVCYDNKTGAVAPIEFCAPENAKVADPIHAIAYVTNAVAPKVVWMERFWCPECFDSTVPQEKRTGGWAECGVNVLTNAIDTNFNEVWGSYNYRAIAVNVKKSTKPEYAWSLPEQFEPFMPTTPNELTPEAGVVMENPELFTENPEFEELKYSGGGGGGFPM